MPEEPTETDPLLAATVERLEVLPGQSQLEDYAMLTRAIALKISRNDPACLSNMAFTSGL